MTDRAQHHEQLLRDAPLLARLATDDFRALIQCGRMADFRRGETLFRQDDPGDAFYVLVEGTVQIALLAPDGREVTLALLGPGECFGDLALLDGRPRSAGAVAASRAKAFVLARAAFFGWLDARPGAARTLLETLSLRLRQKDEALADLAILDLSHRLAKRLLGLAVAASSRGSLAVTQAELAAALGASRQRVNKELKDFESRGWVALARGGLRVTDAPALRRFWQGDLL